MADTLWSGPEAPFTGLLCSNWQDKASFHVHYEEILTSVFFHREQNIFQICNCSQWFIPYKNTLSGSSFHGPLYAHRFPLPSQSAWCFWVDAFAKMGRCLVFFWRPKWESHAEPREPFELILRIVARWRQAKSLPCHLQRSSIRIGKPVRPWLGKEMEDMYESGSLFLTMSWASAWSFNLADLSQMQQWEGGTECQEIAVEGTGRKPSFRIRLDKVCLKLYLNS